MKGIETIMLALCSILSAHGIGAQDYGGIMPEKESSVTFVVDKNLELPAEHFSYAQSEEGIYSSSLLYCGISSDDLFHPVDEEHKLVRSSFAGRKIYGNSSDVMFSMFIRAYAEHRPLVLSPDDVWLLISQSFSYYVNKHPEKLRTLFVDHEGKATLSIRVPGDLFDESTDWNQILDLFSKEIASNTKGDIAETIIADFSTTGRTERIASQITLMNAMQSYFDYEAIYAVCGIPSITLKGTPDDWKHLLTKVRKLGEYGLGWWVRRLNPVLEEFVRASEGNPDRKFWQDIVRRRKPGELRGLSCAKLPKPPTKFDGWFLDFFPFDKHGRTPSRVNQYHQMLPEVIRTEFMYKIVNENERVLKEYPMELIAGFVGFEEDVETCALTPVIGWMVGTYDK